MTTNKFPDIEFFECKNCVLRKSGKNVFFFDDDLLWRSENIETAFDKKIKGISLLDDGTYDVDLCYSDMFGNYYWWKLTENWNYIDRKLIPMIFTRLKVGDNFSKAKDISKKLEIRYFSKEDNREIEYNEVENFVMSIERPNIYRDIENNNKNTFDFVEVIVNISVYHPNKIQFARKNKKKIAKMVLNKIENDKKFKKFGVPVSVLTLKNVMLSKNNFIRYLFEVKSE